MIKVFSLRALTAAIIEKTQQKELLLDNFVMMYNSTIQGVRVVNDGTLKIPKGTLMLASVSVNARMSDYPAESGVGRFTTSSDVSSAAAAVDPVYASQTSSPLVEQCDSIVNDLLLKISIMDAPRVCYHFANLPDTVMSSIKRSLRACDSIIDNIIDSARRLTTMKFDAVSYFVPIKAGGTMLVAVTRTDPTGAPEWIDTTMLKMFGGSTLKSLLEMAEEQAYGI